MDLNWFEELERRIPKGGVRTRFAPSPTGYMHVGNLRTALYTWLIARHSGGTFILRIEDTDQGRLVEGATEVIYNTLRKCGLTWDEGPDIGGPVGPYVQTERRGLYANFAQLLVEKGHAYYCFCGKSESEEDSGEFDRADDPCRALSPEEAQARVDAGEPYVIRQKIPHGGQTTFSDAVFGDITVDNDTLDDQVLLKSDGLPTYNFANVIDDHLMGITHVVRGSEYLSSAPKYNLLYEAFGWDVPTYIHCSPVMRDQHNKMSKRKGDPSYEDLIAMGYLSEAVVNYVTLLGWSPKGEYAEREFFTLAELADVFDIGGISKSPAIFDIEKLKYFNANYLRALSPEAFYEGAEPYLKEAVKTPGIDLTTGSLGQGMSTATGAALANKVDGRDNHVFVFVGDGECDEGQVWEAAQFAAHYKLDHLICFVDSNKRQLDGKVDDIMSHGKGIGAKFDAFGWNVIDVADGNDVEQIYDAVQAAYATTGKPTCIVLNTVKGKGCTFAEPSGAHSSQPSKEQWDEAIAFAEAELAKVKAQ